MGRTLFLLMVAGAAFALSACGPSGGDIRDVRRQAAEAVSAGVVSSEISYVLDDADFTGPDSAASGWVRFSITNQGQNQKITGGMVAPMTCFL